ncbi:putative glycosyltransferase (plasmid) [Mycobacterium sp. JS623]|uniref:glycosyltransferase family 2 protein n=1 Tax=Mycobacterium sp. JS623 TaxID=212767 RepID=UPI0002A59E76|nr:glycosyltransferase family A protein [Mycobacterium sp. JS623]AGB26658.1 putative glycosyltransferase [Mycobacterium sp. JS623]
MHEITRAELRAPARVIDLDIAQSPGDDVLDVDRYSTAWCLIRDRGVVVAAKFFDIETESRLPMAALRDYVVDVGLPKPVGPACNFVSELTVVIPTNRPDMLPIVLESLAAQTDQDFDVLIVDNSADGSVAQALTAFQDLRIRYCHEPIPGVARARNRGLAELTSEFVAWIDDDERADPDWIAWIKRGFSVPAKPGAVAGVMLPAELETDAQVNFERYGGFNKGRPMQPVELRAHTPEVRDPLLPLPNYGAGGNMAFRTELLRRIGGFNNRLGTTNIHGGEDTWVLALALELGSVVLHWPQAVTWHYHRRTDAELERQFFGYTAALTAYFTAVLVAYPKYLTRILSFVPAGIRIVFAPGSREVSSSANALPEDFPEALRRARRKGLIAGPFLYFREVRRQRHLPSAVQLEPSELR